MLTAIGSPLLVVGAALIDDAGRVLVQQRPVGKQHAGLWEFPGGKVEAGETPEAALVRELKEELRIKVDVNAVAPIGFTTATGVVLLLFAIRTWSGCAVSTDGERIEWIAPEVLDELPMPPADRPLIAAVRALV